jgi:hypothetical protein
MWPDELRPFEGLAPQTPMKDSGVFRIHSPTTLISLAGS